MADKQTFMSISDEQNTIQLRHERNGRLCCVYLLKAGSETEAAVLEAEDAYEFGKWLVSQFEEVK